MSPKVLWKMGQTTRVGAVWGGDNDDEGGVKGEGWADEARVLRPQWPSARRLMICLPLLTRFVDAFCT